MSRIIIGNSLDQGAELSLEVGLGLALAFKEKAQVLHADKLADFDTLDSIFTNLNLEIHDHYISSIIEANKIALKKQINHITNDFNEFEFDSRSGSASDVLVKAGKSKEVSLIVLGHDKNKKFLDNFLGGNTESILNRSEKSVLVVKDASAKGPNKILVAYDFSDNCKEALYWAQKFSKTFHSEIHLVNIVPCYYEGYHLAHTYSSGLNAAMEDIIDESVKKIEPKLKELSKEFKGGRPVSTKVLLDKEGSISDKIISYAAKNGIDLIIMGSNKRGVVEKLFLGSVASKVLKASSASVLIAK
jgi:nucleotide-binding universal stress UspA family protein